MDTAETTPTWTDIWTPDELAAALDVHSLRLAKRYGDYSLAADIANAAEAIRDLQDNLDKLTTELATIAGEALGLTTSDEILLAVKRNIELLGRKPQ